MVVPGKYQVRLTVDGQTQTAPLEVKLDPRVSTLQADLEKQFNLLMQIREQLNRVYVAVNQIEDVRAQTEALKTPVCPPTKARARYALRPTA